MLLIALFCQLAGDVRVEPESPLAGAIVIQETALLDNLGISRHTLFEQQQSKWTPATAERAIELNAELHALWTAPAARVDGKVITAQDVLCRNVVPVLIGLERCKPELREDYLRFWIEANLSRAVMQSTLWAAIEREFPPELMKESRQRHEEAWKSYSLTAAARHGTASWKPHWIKHQIVQDYLELKFGPAPQGKALSAWKEQVREFRQDAWKRAKVETAYVLREPLDKPSPGQVVRPVAR